MFLDGYSLTVIAFAIILINPYFHLNALSSGLIVASVIFGSVAGALVVGYFGDIFGRKSVYVLNMVIFVVFGLISAVSFNFLMLFLSRFIIGIAVGADYPVSNSYITEIAPQGLRGKYLAFSGLSFGLGSIFSSLVSAALFPFGPEMWRFMLGIVVIPAIIVMFLRISMPESARWLNVKNSGNKIYIKGMFSKVHIKNTLLYSVIWFLYDIGAYGIGLLIPLIFKKTGLISNEDNALVTSLILFAGIISSIAGLLNIDKIGRKGLQLIGFIGMAIALFSLPSVYKSLTGIILVIFIAEIFNSFASLTVGIFPAELSHTSFR
ncbi:MAG: MFS transporter, partial [Deltaproteobacteria bacterium]|nr:MFS transporter [Deltaproteobacteria bacterium]